MSRPRVVGHRGAAGAAPENTLPSFRRALSELGDPAAAVELDVRLSTDGVPVCFHDDRLDRVTRQRGPLAARTAAELQQVPVLDWAFAGAYPSATIPTLDEVLAALPAATLLVELKGDAAHPEHDERLPAAVLGVLEAHAALPRCRVISFSPELLGRCRCLAGPETLRLGTLAGAAARHELLPLACRLGAVAAHAAHSTVDAGLLAAAHAAGLLLNAWTANAREDVLRLARLGVDEITTDFPAATLAILATM